MATPEPKTNGAPQDVFVTESQAKLNLLQKLASVVAEIDNVDKRGRNEFQKYAYVKAADVAWLVRKALSSRNVYMVADVVEIRNYEIPAKEGHWQAVDLRMEFSFFDGDSPETPPIVLHSWGTGTDKGDKAVYKAMTGALKYGLRHAFLIPDESDPEADTETDKATANARESLQAKGLWCEEHQCARSAKHLKECESSRKTMPSPKEEKKDAQGRPQAQPALFYVEPPSFNGHFVEFVNIKEFLAAKPEIEDSLRLVFTAHKAKKTKGDTALVPTEQVEALCQKLVGDLGLTVKKLEAR